MEVEFKTVREIATLFRVSEPTIYNWMARTNNPIPHHKKENTTRFVESEVIDWFKGER